MAGEELKYVIALGCLHFHNARKVRSLIEGAGSAEKAWFLSEGTHKAEAMAHAERELEFIAKHGIKTYYYTESAYPSRSLSS